MASVNEEFYSLRLIFAAVMLGKLTFFIFMYVYVQSETVSGSKLRLKWILSCNTKVT
jgi:hypothetical protein